VSSKIGREGESLAVQYIIKVTRHDLHINAPIIMRIKVNVYCCCSRSNPREDIPLGLPHHYLRNHCIRKIDL